MRDIILAMPAGILSSGTQHQLLSHRWSVVAMPATSAELFKAVEAYPHALVILSDQFSSSAIAGTVRVLFRDFRRIKLILWTESVASAVDMRGSFPLILGFFFRTSSTDELLRGCQLVNLKQKYYSPQLALAFKRFRDNSEESRLGMGLSKRERQIFRLICLGMTVHRISEQLCISRKTVNTFRYRIFQKLGVESDVQLTHLAIKNGLIEPQAELHFA